LELNLFKGGIGNLLLGYFSQENFNFTGIGWEELGSWKGGYYFKGYLFWLLEGINFQNGRNYFYWLY